MPILMKNGRPDPRRLFLLLGCGAAAAFLCWFLIGLAPAAAGQRETRTVEVPRGAGIARVASMLRQEQLLRSPLVFRIWAKLTGGERAVKAGAYAISPAMSAPRILAVLTDGREQTLRVTIPEGANLREIAAILDRNGIADQDGFLARTRDPELMAEVAPEAAGSLEGFLFPDTYFFSKSAGVDGAIRMMTARFRQVMDGEMRTRAAALGRTVREIVIMASLVEEEAKFEADRPLVAAVFYNRLRVGMALQSCATVQYALGKHKERLLNADLKVDSPYNTYLHPGLPPGPICSPGLASLRAALYPAAERYLYFVARPDGTHVFSRTYNEHLRAQRTIQRAN